MKDLYIITGATGGMGENAARRFKEYGDVLLLDLFEDKLNKLVEELGEGAKAIVFDITKKEDIEKVVDVVKEYGSFKALLHFAGVSESMGNPKKIVDINFAGSVNLNEALYDYAKEGTVVINTSSIAAHYYPLTDEIKEVFNSTLDIECAEKIASLTNGNSSLAYGWGKTALNIFTRQSAIKWGKKGARIVSISPGIILTPMVELESKSGNGDALNMYVSITPVNRIGYPEDITNLCEFLCSDKASFITGTDILIDGGVTVSLAAAENNQ